MITSKDTVELFLHTSFTEAHKINIRGFYFGTWKIVNKKMIFKTNKKDLSGMYHMQ
jgi:hypothetical protein